MLYESFNCKFTASSYNSNGSLSCTNDAKILATDCLILGEASIKSENSADSCRGLAIFYAIAIRFGSIALTLVNISIRLTKRARKSSE